MVVYYLNTHFLLPLPFEISYKQGSWGMLRTNKTLDRGGLALLLLLDLTGVFYMVDYDLLTLCLTNVRGLYYNGFPHFSVARDRGWCMGEGCPINIQLIVVCHREQSFPQCCLTFICPPSPS